MTTNHAFDWDGASAWPNRLCTCGLVVWERCHFNGNVAKAREMYDWCRGHASYGFDAPGPTVIMDEDVHRGMPVITHVPTFHSVEEAEQWMEDQETRTALVQKLAEEARQFNTNTDTGFLWNGVLPPATLGSSVNVTTTVN